MLNEYVNETLNEHVNKMLKGHVNETLNDLMRNLNEPVF